MQILAVQMIRVNERERVLRRRRLSAAVRPMQTNE